MVTLIRAILLFFLNGDVILKSFSHSLREIFMTPQHRSFICCWEVRKTVRTRLSTAVLACSCEYCSFLGNFYSGASFLSNTWEVWGGNRIDKASVRKELVESAALSLSPD